MPISRAVLERQLELAKADREAVAAKVSDGNLKRDPQWRNADAQCRQLTRRLRKVKEVEQLDVELHKRREGSEE